MNHAIKIAMILLGLSTSSVAMAQSGAPFKTPEQVEADSNKQTERDESATAEDSSEDGDKQNQPAPRVEQAPVPDASSRTSRSDETFKPTEEISEDQPVPFPVDI